MTGPSVHWNTVPLTGHFSNLDATPCTGSLLFEVDFDVVSITDQVIFPAGGVLSIPLIAGSFAWSAPATDDPDNLPVTWQYKVTRRLDGYGDKTVYMDVPLAAAGTGIDMSSVFSIADVTPSSPGVLLRGVPNGLAALNGSGQVVDSTGTPVSGIPAGHFAVKIHGATGLPYIDTTGA